MKTLISTLAITAALVLGGPAVAQDAMSTPMADDAMASDAMGGDAMSSMTPDEVLAACLEKAGMETDAMKRDEATKACHDAHTGAMEGDAMGGDAMMSTDGMAADPGAMAPAQ